MADTKSGEIKLQVRGKLDKKSPIYVICRDSETSLFRTLKGLAEEAVAVRSQLAPVNGPEHPLQNRLSNMSSSEAVTFLLGITQNTGATTLSKISDSTGETSKTNPSLTEPPSAADSVDEDWNKGMADALEALSEIPK
jgi:hypothetical protein